MACGNGSNGCGKITQFNMLDWARIKYILEQLVGKIFSTWGSLETKAKEPLHLEKQMDGYITSVVGWIDEGGEGEDGKYSSGMMTAEQKAWLDEMWEKYQNGDFNCTCERDKDTEPGPEIGGDEGGDEGGVVDVTFIMESYIMIENAEEDEPLLPTSGDEDIYYATKVSKDEETGSVTAFEITLPWHLKNYTWHNMYAYYEALDADGNIVSRGASNGSVVAEEGTEVECSFDDILNSRVFNTGNGHVPPNPWGKFTLADNPTSEMRTINAKISPWKNLTVNGEYQKVYGPSATLTIYQEGIPEGAEFDEPIVELSYPTVAAEVSSDVKLSPTYSYSQAWRLNGEEQEPITGGGTLTFDMLETYIDGLEIDEDGVVTVAAGSTNNTGVERTLATVQLEVTAYGGKTGVATANIEQGVFEESRTFSDANLGYNIAEGSYPTNDTFFAPKEGGTFSPTIGVLYREMDVYGNVTERYLNPDEYEIVRWELSEMSGYEGLVELDTSTGVITVADTSDVSFSGNTTIAGVRVTIRIYDSLINGEGDYATYTFFCQVIRSPYNDRFGN